MEDTRLHFQLLVQSLCKLTHFFRVIPKHFKKILTLGKSYNLKYLVLSGFVLPDIPFIEHCVGFINNFRRPSFTQDRGFKHLYIDFSIFFYGSQTVPDIKPYSSRQ